MMGSRLGSRGRASAFFVVFSDGGAARGGEKGDVWIHNIIYEIIWWLRVDGRLVCDCNVITYCEKWLYR